MLHHWVVGVGGNILDWIPAYLYFLELVDMKMIICVEAYFAVI